MIFNPLARILDDNWLTGPNYVDWKRNLMIVLSADKIGNVLTSESPELGLDNASWKKRKSLTSGMMMIIWQSAILWP